MRLTGIFSLHGPPWGVLPGAPAVKPAPASRKRKSTEDPAAAAAAVNLDEIDIEDMPMTENCDQIRRKINRFIDSGAMSKTAFAKEIGHGAMKGCNFAAYDAAWAYFKKREVAGLKILVKKPKLSAGEGDLPATATAGSGAKATAKKIINSADVDISDKINAHLMKPGVTQAQFCRDIHAELRGPKKPNSVQGSRLARFRGMKGAASGAKTLVHIKEGKPKSKHRLEMEQQWPEGFRLDVDGNIQ
ncbi:hypothetical protein B0H66DRAFT_634958 [Apodospora peruviana]|uniref:DUF7726 domain-containing protein n=1 Tax=Apodospora peruviana TaxID=516989 RepID=A0AAE0IRQ5_9PEZI|nr:hypothetical protein B0H66DRAFT_634958 [Apodospora peruviana]